MIETTEANQSITAVQCQGQEKASTITDDARPALVSYSANEDSNGYHILAGADATLGSIDEQKALHSACLEGQTEIVESLLWRIANINGREIEFENETPLAAACRMGHLDIVDLLLQKRADPNVPDDDLWTPLHWACFRHKEVVVQRLLQVNGLNINAIENKMNQTPLNLAVEKGHAYIVDLLLKKNADLYIKDSMGWTPLMTATRMENLDIVRMILGHKIGWRDGYLEVTDERYYTPLHVASMQGYYGIASALISAGAKCDARSRSGDTDHGWPDYPGYTPLHHACAEDQLEIVGLLLPEVPLPGVEVDAQAADWRTPLHLASLVGSERIVKLLLERKADINATDDEGSTPLHLASGYGPGWRKRTPERDLIKPERNSFDDSESVKECWNSSPRQYVSVIELLMRQGADPTIIDEYGCTALHNAAIAVSQGNIEKLLELVAPDALSWRDWKQSPTYSALLGEHPLAAMESLLANQKIKAAPFWENGGKLQVIEMAARMVKPFDILGLIFRELPSEREVVTAAYNWNPIQWAAHERLPGVLSKLIDDSSRAEDIVRMVHEALQATSKSITPKEFEQEPACELLVQVIWTLITNSQRTLDNMAAVRGAWNFVCNNSPLARHARAMPSNIGELCDELRIYVLDAQDRKQMHNKALHRDKDFRLFRENRKVKASLSSTHCGLWETIERLDRRFGKEQVVNTKKKVKNFTILKTLQDILNDPPFAQISQTQRDEVDYKPPVPGPIDRRIIEKAEATVVAFFKAEGESGRIRRNRPIKEIVYDPGPTEVVGTAIRNLIDMAIRGSMRFNSNLYAKKNLKVTWVHLPSTNASKGSSVKGKAADLR